MGIYIKGNIKMPKNCYNCWLGHECPKYEALLWNEISKERKADCPLSYISPHGDLIDRDALRDNNNDAFEIEGADGTILALDVSIIDNAPTIIQAEEEEHTMEEFMYRQEGNPNDSRM